MSRFSNLLLACTVTFLCACGGGGGGITTGGGGGPAAQLLVNGPKSSAAGFKFSFFVMALTSDGGIAQSYSGTVHFTSSDPAAVLPANATLSNGSGMFSATLPSAGLQTISATDTVSSSLQGSFSVNAVAGEFPVSSFGATGDGHTDDTAALQNAITAAGAAGGGSVVLDITRYFTTGTLVVPAGVVLTGPYQGPFDINGINPAQTAVAPTILITNNSAPFLTLQGVGAGVTDLLFHYPNQVGPETPPPTPYPYTILVTAPGTKVARCTVINAYDFLDIEAGRVIVEDMFIGAFHNDINIDHARDHVTLHNLNISVVWDVAPNVPYPSPMDAWVTSNGTSIIVRRADSLEMSDIIVFTRFTGILLTDSPDASQGIRCGYGTASDIDLDTMIYGIVVTASNTPGYKFTNVDIGWESGGQAAVQLRTGGSMPPKILINGGSNRGLWIQGAYPPPPVGTMQIVNILP